MQKVWMQIIKNVKRNRYKRTNTDIPMTYSHDTPMTFSQGDWDKVWNETKRVLISKEQKQIYKRRRRRDAQRIRQKSSSIW